jgi:hypothetical protein
MEFRKIMGNIHANGNQAGTFVFARAATGLLGINSGSPVASFLLGAVDHADVAFRAVDSWYPRQHAWVFHGGDTWRANQKLTLDYGLRWDYSSPSSEKYDHLSFFDPAGANPGAGDDGRSSFLLAKPSPGAATRTTARRRGVAPAERAQVQSCELRNSERPARAGMW